MDDELDLADGHIKLFGECFQRDAVDKAALEYLAISLSVTPSDVAVNYLAYLLIASHSYHPIPVYNINEFKTSSKQCHFRVIFGSFVIYDNVKAVFFVQIYKVHSMGEKMLDKSLNE